MDYYFTACDAKMSEYWKSVYEKKSVPTESSLLN